MWQTPKTLWQPTDYFEHSDWQRIRGNLQQLALLAAQKGRPVSQKDLPAFAPGDGYTPQALTDAEENLAALAALLPKTDFFPGSYYNGSRFWNAAELTQMETTMQTIYSSLSGL